ncbi:MAG TPA: tetratricopeptide repeat protein [Tepidisphaeraceae bacterium]|nr:tetratricopeptide repeat protein [Tepidisphaeraceae bacterium]
MTTNLKADSFLTQSIPDKWLAWVTPDELPPLDYPSYASGLDHARMQAEAGRYVRALMTLMTLQDPDPVEAALIKGTCLAATGRRDEALAALTDPAVSNDPRVQVKTATILAELGQTAKAIDLLKLHLSKYPNSLAGHFWLGQLNEQIGNLAAARLAYEWFVVDPQNFLEKWQKQRERAFDSAADLTLVGRAIDRWATLTGSYKDLTQLHDTLIGLFVRTYDVVDRDYWPAHIAAAEYFLSHDNTTKAVEELAVALAANPNDIYARGLLGKIAVEGFNFDGTDAQIDKIREIDPHSIVATMLETRNLLQQRLPAAAGRSIQRVLAQQPDNIEALSLYAASEALQLHDEKTAEILKQIDKLAPDNATGYLEVADQLGAMRQYPRAIEAYKSAVARAPWWTAARNGLGLLYTQSGDEDDAKSTLDLAHALDPYNLRTTNYLRLLDSLQAFARKETDHFVVMYDAKLDPVIPEYFSDYLESVYAQVCEIYQAQPKVKTYIEVFPTHDAFSVRTTGSPWIGTVGASTGRVIALVAPRKGQATMGSFNWAQVLRHEFTHTVTLAATDNRIPHWMTEGLAVCEEHAPLKWEWIPMLYSAVNHEVDSSEEENPQINELFTMDNLTWGFVRPKKPTDRSLAYAESYWICFYINEKYGHDAILNMLDAVRNGLSEKEMFQKVLGKSSLAFQEEFFAWTKKEVAGWGYDRATTEKYNKLREEGEALVKDGKYVAATKVWEQIVAIRPVDELPHQRLAGLYLTKEVNQPEKAVDHLKILHAVELKDNRFAKRIARIYRDTNKMADALAYATQSVYIDPYDPDAHQLLLEIGQKTSNQAVIDREQRVIPILKAWIEANRPKPLPG